MKPTIAILILAAAAGGIFALKRSKGNEADAKAAVCPCKMAEAAQSNRVSTAEEAAHD
jgi:hypothetical protein